MDGPLVWMAITGAHVFLLQEVKTGAETETESRAMADTMLPTSRSSTHLEKVVIANLVGALGVCLLGQIIQLLRGQLLTCEDKQPHTRTAFIRAINDHATMCIHPYVLCG